jgi:FAD/FMN-containing dehydrogenase/Fe-S oxidoreductase
VNKFKTLKSRLKCEFYTDGIHQSIYATDASSYREIPSAVAIPKDIDDLKYLIDFANTHKIPLIPRAAGTSLSGQVVGNGIVVDVSKYFRKILEVNAGEKWVRVQPGVVLDELNLYLEPFGLFFGPETSTANRCMIGGMLGNNSCGSHSLIYGSTRDHTLEVTGLLSDGSEVVFGEISSLAFDEKCQLRNLEGKIYQNIKNILSNPQNKQEIIQEYPNPAIKRRNTGYALDLLLNTEPFGNSDNVFNFSKLIAGSEGTLVFITEIKLNLVPLPPKESGVVAAHFQSLEESLEANLVALKYFPGAVELIDKNILDLTRDNLSQKANRFFIQGNPEAILVIEFARSTREEISTIANAMEAEMRAAGYGYHFPLIFGQDIKKIWALRKAGLGVLTNIPGDAKPIGFIEDTAVCPADLPQYISDFKALLSKYDLECVYHAHIATGELHLRPVIDLKTKKGVELYYTIALETAHLVKKYNGSLSGEHGDGRLRGQFLPVMYGQNICNLFRELKKTWDPNFIFNPGKIIDTPPMDTSLRYTAGEPTREVDSIFNFSKTLGYVRAIENCNGSGDCRKSHRMPGTMCPSYQATLDEKNTTRARANMLREIFNNKSTVEPFTAKEAYAILDLCLSCKACKSECPSGVDMAKLKAEFLQHYYLRKGVPLRSWLIANIPKINQLAMPVSSLYNFFISNPLLSQIFSRLSGFSLNRVFPTLSRFTLRTWAKYYLKDLNQIKSNGYKSTVYLFADEFTNFNDVEIGIKAIQLLESLGYKVIVPNHVESGRTYLSKGFVKKAKKTAIKNIDMLNGLISPETPLLGIEPSAILTFRDEYPDLFDPDKEPTYFAHASELAKNTMMLDDFLASELDKGQLKKELFTDQKKQIKLHGHCYQKALTGTNATRKILAIPINYTVDEIPSGCCGMAGSFGYEKEHFGLSMQVGELVLFPAVREAGLETLIVAPGTSCRHQIKDGTGIKALHPVEVLWAALKSRVGEDE